MMSPLTAQFKQRLAATGTSVATQKAYPFQIQQLLAAARRLGLSDRDGPAELFRDEALLGRAMIDDRSCTGGTLSRWTLAQRRAAVRSFARLMAPELRPVLGGHPEAVVMRALRRVAERIGGGFRLGGGKPRHRGGPAPTSAEIAAIIAVAATAPGSKASATARSLRCCTRPAAV